MVDPHIPVIAARSHVLVILTGVKAENLSTDVSEKVNDP